MESNFYDHLVEQSLPRLDFTSEIFVIPFLPYYCNSSTNHHFVNFFFRMLAMANIKNRVSLLLTVHVLLVNPQKLFRAVPRGVWSTHIQKIDALSYPYPYRRACNKNNSEFSFVSAGPGLVGGHQIAAKQWRNAKGRPTCPRLGFPIRLSFS